MIDNLRKCTCGGEGGILNEDQQGKDDSAYPTGTIIGCKNCGLKTGWMDIMNLTGQDLKKQKINGIEKNINENFSRCRKPRKRHNKTQRLIT